MAVKKKKTRKKVGSKVKPKSSFKIKWDWYTIGVIAVAFLVYANTLNHGYVLDDDLVCAKNRYVSSGFSGIGDIFTHSLHEGFTGTPDRNYRPVMMAAFAIEKQFFGESPQTHHFFNVFWYALACGLLFLTLRLIFKEHNQLLPLGIALLFAAHPIHTEVVANIKSRDEIFLFLGLMGTVYSVMKYCQKGNLKWLLFGLAAYLFAALSKESGLAVLGIVPLTAYFFGGQNKTRLFKTTGYFLIPVILYFLLYFNATGDSGQQLGITDNSLYAAESLLDRLATAIAMMGDYLWLLVFPVSLSYDYSAFQVPIMAWTDFRPIVSLIVWAGLAGFTLWSIVKGNKNLVAYGIGFFLIMFGMVSNVFFLTGVTMAERLLFSPSLGFCMILGYYMYEFLFKKGYSNYFYGLLGVIFVLYSFKTFDRNAVWKSDATLFSTGIHTAPNSSRSNTFYGTSLFEEAKTIKNVTEQRQKVEEAIAYYDKALSIYDGFTECHHHKGDAFRFLNRHTEAIKAYEAAVATQPKYHPSLYNMGLSYLDLGVLDKAIE
ncbi:MAG: DUF1736 domain-containing protein, partial [Bacteroidia bacterium]|nr:DUF1736 domain-containing protein [Bacteroidia bacterium]